MISKKWMIAHAVLGDAGPLKQLTNYGLIPGVQMIDLGFDGAVDRSFVTPGLVAPSIAFDMLNIKDALDAAGFDGLKLAGSETFTGYFQMVAEGAIRAAAADNHLKMAIAKGILIPLTLTVADNQPASISMLAAAVSPDGTTLPIIVTDGQTYTASAAATVGYTLGPIKPAGTDVGYTGNLGMTIDFGIRLDIASGDGEGFPTFVFIVERRPVITFTSTDASLIDTLSETGKTIENASTAIYLRKFSKVGNNVIRVTNVTAEHIKFTVPGLYGTPQTIGGAHGEPIGASVEFLPYSVSGAAAIGINTASAIAANV